MDQDIVNKIKELAEQAKVFLDFEKVILFGSFSKGNAHECSDIDVAFFVNEISPDHWQLSAKLFELVYNIDNRIETIIINEKTDKSGFAQSILKSGIRIS